VAQLLSFASRICFVLFGLAGFPSYFGDFAGRAFHLLRSIRPEHVDAAAAISGFVNDIQATDADTPVATGSFSAFVNAPL
jgi:hypothetical protein